MPSLFHGLSVSDWLNDLVAVFIKVKRLDYFTLCQESEGLFTYTDHKRFYEIDVARSLQF